MDNYFFRVICVRCREDDRKKETETETGTERGGI